MPKPRTFADKLADLGFASYRDYLNSALWAGIRSRVYDVKGRTCIRCKERPATEVHHTKYDDDTLAGRSIISLVPVCRDCHEREHDISQPGEGVAVVRIPWTGKPTEQIKAARAKRRKAAKVRKQKIKQFNAAKRAKSKRRQKQKLAAKVERAGCNPRAFGLGESQ
jgi:hypothetical protein